MNQLELERYLDNLKEEALKQVIRTLMEGNKKFIQAQVNEFNKMYPKGGE